jgi:aryl-alcohol dehydrogenase-like predicted oxidoreductase
MDYRRLGRTGVPVSALGFGCGAVGGLLIRGTPAERERAVARALELGITYFDTAPIYGDGVSERHLGQALRALKAAPLVGTKLRVDPARAADMPAAVGRSLEESLARLGMERVDLLQLHNLIAADARGRAVAARDVLDTVVPALAKLADQGKIRFWGITALGETPALLDVLEAGTIHTAQVCLNLLNPSAAHPVPAGFPAQDFGRLLPRARERGVGAIVIRVLAGGALSGVEARHPYGMPSVEPISTGADYATDVRRAARLQPLVAEGHAASLTEASIRLALASDAVSTVLVGCSTLQHLEDAAAAVARGPLGPDALARLPGLWATLASP